MLARALRPDIRTVVLSSRWINWRLGEPANPGEATVDVRLVDDTGTAASELENRAKFKRDFQALVSELTRAGKRVVIVGPYPEPTFNVPHRPYVAGFGLAKGGKLSASYAHRHRVILAFFRGLRGVSFIWPAKAMCESSCPVEADGLPLYFDHNHLTVAEARRLSPIYGWLRQ